MHISKFVTPEIIFGNNSINQVGESLRRLGAKKVFVVSDHEIFNFGWTEEAIYYLRQNGLSHFNWNEVTSNPKDYEIHEGVKKYLHNDCDAVLGVGGGSVIDAAKSIALLGTNGGTIHQYEGVDKITVPLPPMVMIPTTAGSGSEVSQFSIIVDTKRSVKMTIISKSLVPDIAIIDPRTLTTMDHRLTAYTGMDVLTHAIESYISLAATPLTQVLSLQAIRLVAKFLRPSTASKYNMAAKESMAMASLQAGLAFSNAILGAAHAISHQLGGLLDCPHGEVTAILLPHVMQFNLIACPEKYIDMAEAFGEKTFGLSEMEASRLAIQAVQDLVTDLGIPATVSKHGLQDDHIPALSQNALNDACMITNPRDMTLEDIASILKQIV
ncbi:iron-containing alcohol dehydrogenase [Fodinisporobacter ferrooxydans]|uniref:Iron-containing alcohol dehydrogenase n=1 Tax=Fodinisporobacter ferrooxydans TaxID=2901836 RepID=A0ABY4CR71_9BACL|nr:iron-containing alcohol dehydrogenase [Alicyclobacillaceae bacterium MYW30-H2]